MLDKKTFEFPKYFGTRLINQLNHLGITADDLIYNLDGKMSWILSHHYGIGMVSLLKITRFRSESIDCVVLL